MCHARGRLWDLRWSGQESAVGTGHVRINAHLGEVGNWKLGQRGVDQQRECLGGLIKAGYTILRDDLVVVVTEDRLCGLQQALHGSVDVVLCGSVDCRVQGAHLRVQVFAQPGFVDKVLPHIAALIVGGGAVGVADGLGKESTFDFSSPGFANSEEVLWFLAIGVGPVGLLALSYGHSDPSVCTDLGVFIILGSTATHDQFHILAANCMEHFVLDVCNSFLVTR